MGWYGSPAIDKGGNFRDRKLPTMPLGNTRQIGWGRAQSGSGRAIATAGLAMTGATVAQKVLLPRAHRGSWD